jgi:activator of HSP90 ATPase
MSMNSASGRRPGRELARMRKKAAGVAGKRRKTSARKSGKATVIEQVHLIEARPSEVYEMYVDPKKHAEFTGSPATGTPREGGRFTAWDGYITGKYLTLEKGRRIVHEWKTTEWPRGRAPSVVEIDLSQKRRATELRMSHTDVPAEQSEGYAQGWTKYYWEPLKSYFKTHKSG